MAEAAAVAAGATLEALPAIETWDSDEDADAGPDPAEATEDDVAVAPDLPDTRPVSGSPGPGAGGIPRLRAAGSRCASTITTTVAICRRSRGRS